MELVSLYVYEYTNVREIGFAQLCIGGPLASLVGRLWALRISITVMIIGV